MASTDVKCESCEHKGKTELAKQWCNECSVGYCDQCVKHHTKIKQLRIHHLIPVDDRAKGIPVVSELCPDHNIPYDSFCTQHDSILCRTCFQTDHTECEILDLDEACKMSKTSTSLRALESDIENIEENLTRGIEQRQETESKMQQEKQTIQKQIDTICAKMIKNADNLEEKLLNDFKKKVDQVSEEKMLERVVLENTKINTKQIEDGITSIKANATDKQAFLAIQNNHSKLLRHKDAAVTALERCSDFEISFESIEFAFKQAESLGEVIITKDSKPSEFSEGKKSQAQIHIHGKSRPQIHATGTLPIETKDISKLDDHKATEGTMQPDMNIPNPKFEKLQLKQEIRIGQGLTEMSVISCALLPNRKMVFLDDNCNSLIVHNRNGEYQTVIAMEPSAFDVTAIDDNKVAVTRFGGVDIVNVDAEMIERPIILADRDCFGISFSNKNLYVMTTRRTCRNILVLTLKGRIVNIIDVKINDVYSIVAHNNKVHYIDLKSHTVYACDSSGKQLWTYKDLRLKRPQCIKNNFSNGLSVDDHGNVFVALPDDNNILLISSDGIPKEDSLDLKNFLIGPSGVSFLKESDKLLICNVTNGFAALFVRLRITSV